MEAVIVMSSKHLRGDINLAYPTGEIAVMGPEGAISIVLRDALKKAADPLKARDEMVQQYREAFANPFKAAESGYVDARDLPGGHSADTHSLLGNAQKQAGS